MSAIVDTAMVLAAGLGTRIRALDPDTPKPLIKVAGRPLIDYTLSMLTEGGVERAVVNVHHKADQIEAYLAKREGLAIDISDERGELLETGGGIVKALERLGPNPFACTNTDAIMLSAGINPLEQLKEAWTEETDALLLLVPRQAVTGYNGAGDFSLSADGRIEDLSTDQPLVFTGLQILRPQLFAGAAIEKISTRAFWQKARAAGRMRGAIFEGTWMHVGDPEGHRAAEARLAG